VSAAEATLAVTRARELLNFITSALQQVTRAPRLELLSLNSVLKAVIAGPALQAEPSRFVDLTQAQATPIDENVLSAMHELFSLLDALGVRALEAASEASPATYRVVWTTYARGKASENFIQLNSTPSMVLTNVTTLLAELQNVAAVITELAAMLEELERPRLPRGGGAG
jgi:hypothetical protein